MNVALSHNVFGLCVRAGLLAQMFKVSTETRLTQNMKAHNQEISAVNIYGHDAYLCACAICDEDGKSLFKQTDIDELKKKNGAVIGRIAIEIVKFSDMAGDVEAMDEIKN